MQYKYVCAAKEQIEMTWNDTTVNLINLLLLGSQLGNLTRGKATAWTHHLHDLQKCFEPEITNYKCRAGLPKQQHIKEITAARTLYESPKTRTSYKNTTPVSTWTCRKSASWLWASPSEAQWVPPLAWALGASEVKKNLREIARFLVVLYRFLLEHSTNIVSQSAWLNAFRKIKQKVTWTVRLTFVASFQSPNSSRWIAWFSVGGVPQFFLWQQMLGPGHSP